MELLRNLFSDWVGILSVFTVAFILAMAGYLISFVIRHVRDESGGHPRPH